MSTEDGFTPGCILGIVAAVVAAIGVLIFLATMTWASAQSDRVAVCRNGGMFDDKSVRGVIDPGEGPTYQGQSTNCPSYPVSTRIYDASGSADADRGALSCTANDAVSMRVAAAVRFTLNTEDHGQIIESYNEVLNRYDADTDDGWDRMLDATIGRELDAQIEATCRQFSGRSMASDPDVLQEVQESLADNLRNRINENVGTDLFCGPGVPYGDAACPELNVSVTRIIADSEATRNAFESEVQAEAETRAAQQEIRTAEAHAEAILAQAAASAQAGDNYVELQWIQLCLQQPNACPQVLIVPTGQDTNINVPAPAG